MEFKFFQKELELQSRGWIPTFHDISKEIIEIVKASGVKNGTVMWPARISVSGKTVTPGGAIEILDILGREESLARMEKGLEKFL